MGNQPNNFVQCGFDNRQKYEQKNLTRQQAIKQTKHQQLDKPEIFSSNVNTLYRAPTFNNQQQKEAGKKISYVSQFEKPKFIPDHQNIISLSKIPKDKYTKMAQNNIFQQQKGKCLDQIIESRYNTNMYFPQYQVVSLIQSLVYSLAYMTKKQINYHDFYPTNIYYNKGGFKILNPMGVKYSGYSLTQNRKRFSFLSPELILQVLSDKPELEIQRDIMDKSDVFAIGMVLLEFGSLQPSSECYDPQTYSLVDSIIQQRIDKIKSIYNPLISQCIDLMLQYEVHNRVSPLQLAYIVYQRSLEVKDQRNQQSRIKQNNYINNHTIKSENAFNHHIDYNNNSINPLKGVVYMAPHSQPFTNLKQPQKLNHKAPQFQLNSQNHLNKLAVQDIKNGHKIYATNNLVATNLIPQTALKPIDSSSSKYIIPSQNGVAPSSIPPLSQNSQRIMRPPLTNLKNELKTNPFEEIQQNIKQEQQQAEKYTIKINSSADSKLNQNNKFIPENHSAQYKFRDYYKNSSINTMPSNNQKSYILQTTKQQNLNQRVKRILQASKNIK